MSSIIPQSEMQSALRQRPWHTPNMSNPSTYPYSLEITPAEKPTGHFKFAIRHHGKLLQRSDRPYDGEREARKRGLAEIEKLLHGVTDRR
jgi:hypothetical protein